MKKDFKRKTQNNKRNTSNNRDTSWNNISRKYNKLVGEKGQYFHEHIIFPGIEKIMPIKNGQSVLDLGCGQGVFARTLKNQVKYVGIDLAPELIENAKEYNYDCDTEFFVSDVTKDLQLRSDETFDFALSILAIQNVENFENVVRNVKPHLKENGQFLIVINHPAYRIPKHSSWEIDLQLDIQYRRIDRYMSSMKIPIVMNPGALEHMDKTTWSFHNPIEYYMKAFINNGFAVTGFEEWCSDKVSEGRAANMENVARDEFPMFMAIVGQLQSEN